MNLLYKFLKLKQDVKYRKVHLGVNSKINLGVKINKPLNLYIGNNTYINRRRIGNR